MHRPHRPLSSSVVLIALALAALGAPAVALAAPPPSGPPPARTTPTAGPPPAPARPGRGATPRPPAHDRPGALAGVRYDPARDTVGAGDTVGRYRDEQVRNGVPEGDADRIALAHYTYDCQQTGDCARTGLDLSGVDVNDAHANFGYHPECQAWGVDFLPWWGVWSPPDGQPTCAGGGGTGGTGTVGAGRGLDPGTLAGRILAALDWRALLTALLKGLYEVLVGDGIAQLGDQLAGFVLATPNLLGEDGGMGNVQRLVDDLRAAAVGACLVAFTATVIQFMAGREQEPGAALGRLLAVLLALGFYRSLVGWTLRGASALSSGIQHVGADTTTGAFTTTLKLLLPTAAPLWYLLGLLGALLVIAIGVVKIVGLAFLLLTYVAGPLLLPLGIHPRTAGWVGVWLEHLVKALLWPALWALEFRVFGAITGGLTLTDARGAFSPATGALGALTALALLAIMAGTPWGLHTQFTLRRGAQVVVRQAGRAADAAVAAATGGASLTVKGAVAGALASRRAAPPAAGD